MLYKNRKMSQSEIDEVYEDFVIEIADKVEDSQKTTEKTAWSKVRL